MIEVSPPVGTTTALRIRREAAAFLRDVEMRFGTTRALRDVTLAIPKGSLCGLVGPNGAGKTTTMRILVTDLEPTEGEVEVLGCALPRQAQEIRPRIGYMPDNAALYEELTLAEYLDFFAAFYGLKKEKRREALPVVMELAGVSAFANRRLVGLSKGERQRVMLARTLIHDPDFLVLDEPADGLDPRGRVELRELLLLLHEKGKTILVSSHILSDLEEICTHLVLIDRGRVLFQGSRERLLKDRLQSAKVRLEVIDGMASLVSILESWQGVSIEREDPAAVEISMPVDPQSANRLLRHLVEQGVRLTSFSRTTESLESMYLRLTEKDAGE